MTVKSSLVLRERTCVSVNGQLRWGSAGGWDVRNVGIVRLRYLGFVCDWDEGGVGWEALTYRFA